MSRIRAATSQSVLRFWDGLVEHRWPQASVPADYGADVTSLTTSPGLRFRPAARADVPFIVVLLADDPLGATREDVDGRLSESYWAAFEEIDHDPNQLLVVGERHGRIVATAQLSFLVGLSRRGAWRAAGGGACGRRRARTPDW